MTVKGSGHVLHCRYDCIMCNEGTGHVAKSVHLVVELNARLEYSKFVYISARVMLEMLGRQVV
jgi:hypothetical protein